MKVLTGVLSILLSGAFPAANSAPQARLVVHLDRPGFRISPTFYGLMTEEINHSYDGGLYAELIRNRIFQDDPNQPVYWSVAAGRGSSGTIAIDRNDPVNSVALTNSLRLDIASVAPGERVGVANEGFWGIPVRPRTRYTACFYARSSPGFTGPLTVDIERADGSVVWAKAAIPVLSASWRKYVCVLSTGDCAPSEDNRFVVSASHAGSVWLSLVSLFPPTFHNRANGNRIDLMQLLAGMHPSFLRLPGGNYLEGNSIAERFDWKKTIGQISGRPGHESPWGYRSSDGMGLLEYMEWCEDLRMQPVLAVYAGYSLDGEHVAPGPDLAPYVQSALDEIEYVAGGVDTPWGAERAKDGHPKPFPLKYVEVGNEDFFDRSGSYDGRFTQFYDAIKAKYPSLQIIATTTVHSRTPDVYDDHYYRSAVAMERDSGHYDTYDRKGPRIFVGEWASTEGRPTPNFHAALGDAAWLTGLERNSDLVIMESYAPLLVNVNSQAAQWGTNLIGYDALSSFGSPSYYVQSMFAAYTGDTEAPVAITQPPAPVAAAPAPHGKIGVGTWATQAEYADITVTSSGQTLYQKDFSTGDSDWSLGPGTWQTTDGALAQTSDRSPSIAYAGDDGWGDYTYNLRAKKLSGNEGFLILFHYRNRGDFVQWNIGGWGNTRTRLQRTEEGESVEFGPNVPMSIETGRWYDIRIELRGQDIRCYLDGKLIEEAQDTPPAPPAPLYASASRDAARHLVYLKVVNVGDQDQPLQIDLEGARSAGKSAAAEILTGSPNDQNSIDSPKKVFPQNEKFAVSGPNFVHVFPAHSVTVMQLTVGR